MAFIRSIPIPQSSQIPLRKEHSFLGRADFGTGVVNISIDESASVNQAYLSVIGQE